MTGIAAGIMIVLGRRAWPALVTGLVAGAVAASLIGEKSLLTSLLRSICSAGEAVMVAWLLERWFGRPFAFSGLPRVAGFLAVAGLAAAAFATGGAATTTLLNPAVSFWDVWRVWFLSNAIGIVFVAPLIIELARAWREPPSRREMTEGIAVLVLLALVASYVHTHPTSSWISFDPEAFTLPLLLWLAVRCSPPFAITGSFVVSILAICTTALGIGHLSDAGLPLVERVHGVQTTVMVTTAYTLVLVALFSERGLRAALLERSNERLHNQEVAFRRLLGALPAAIHTTDTGGRITYYNKAAAEMWGVSPKLNKDKCSDLGRLYLEDGTLVPPDECPTRACLMAGRAIEGREALFERPDGKRVPIIPYPAPLTDDKGTIVGVVSMKLDISKRKRAEAALAERNAQLDLAHVAARVGSFTYDIVAGTVRLSGASAPIFGGNTRSDMEITVEQWSAQVHPDDLRRLRAENVCAFSERRRELVSEFRFVLPGGETRWLEARSVVAYGDAGRAERITGVYIDVTERRKTEDNKSLLIAELDHRVKNVLACVAAIAQRSRECSRSSDEFLEVLNGRINSLANAHALLSRSRWEGVELGELVRNELAPCMTDSNLIGGPDIVLAAEATQPLSMVLHELATNASKYGALSSRRGRVSVSWERQSSAHDRLALEWRETGGPTIVAPGPSGYGSFVIRDLIPYELGGSVDYVLAPEGVRCRVEIPARWLSDSLR